MRVGMVPATQTRHPWRATVRTVAAAVVGLLPLLPSIADQLGLATVPAVVTVLAVTGAVTRVLAMPAVEEWLHDHFRGLLSAQPPPER
jgi:hypothetical protein